MEINPNPDNLIGKKSIGCVRKLLGAMLGIHRKNRVIKWMWDCKF